MFADLLNDTPKAQRELSFNDTTTDDSAPDTLFQLKQCQTTKKTFSCEYPECEKTFLYKSELNRHMQSHANSRPYICPFAGCEKGFKRLDTLQTHCRLHTGEKPYMCDYPLCGMNFTTQSALRYHHLKHTNNKMYKCEVPNCGKSFLTIGQLRQHEKGKCRSRAHVFEDRSCSNSSVFMPKELTPEQAFELRNERSYNPFEYANNFPNMQPDNSMMFASIIVKKLKKLLE